MALLHRDEPVTDATVDCPECRAIDWVVRTPRLGFVRPAMIVCRACGHEAAPYFDINAELTRPVKATPVARDLASVPFAVYAPRDLPWEVSDLWEEAGVLSVTVTCETPLLFVTTETDQHSQDVPSDLRDALYGALTDEVPSRGRSSAAYLLELQQQDARIEAELAELSVEAATLSIDGRDVACQRLHAGRAWAAYATFDGFAVVVGADGSIPSDVELVRAN